MLAVAGTGQGGRELALGPPSPSHPQSRADSGAMQTVSQPRLPTATLRSRHALAQSRYSPMQKPGGRPIDNAPHSADQMHLPVVQPVSPTSKLRREDIRCVVCGTQFRNTKLLRMHMRLVHRMRVMDSPDLSSFDGATLVPLENKASVDMHAENISDLKMKTDEMSLLNSSSELPIQVAASSSHQSSTEGSTEVLPLPCQFCQILFWDKGKLMEHQNLCSQRTLQDKDQDALTCPLCHLTFLDNSKLTEHVARCGHIQQQAVPIQTPASCPYCQLLFWDQQKLSSHMWTCGKQSGTSNQCEECGKSFQSRTSLVDHVNSMHKGMQFSCPDCGETFKWRTCVYRHKSRCCANKRTLQATTTQGGQL